MTFVQPFSGYEILAKVGAGAMGTVFRARQKQMNRIVALKVLRPSLARNEKYVERLRREARIVGALNHPNIVTGYDLGEEGGYHYFVMEFVEGQSLRMLLQEWGFFPEEKVLDVGIQVTEALDHAFGQGVIHRDVKPGNILIDDDGLVKLTDMGLAKGPTDMQLTRDGATVGTPQFISPEQAVDPQKADVRSDLYSVGASLFQMATGAAPFSGETIGKLIDQVLNEPAPLASDLNPAISEGLSLVIKKLLAKDPALRYQTPSELLADLRRVQQNERPGVDLRRLEKADRSLERAERRGDAMKWVAGLLVSAACVIGLVLLIQATVGDTGASEIPSDRVLAAELQQELDTIEALRDRIELCETYLKRATGAAEQRVVDEASAPLFAELRDLLDRHCDDAIDSAKIDTWINEPEHWRDADRFVRDVVVPGVYAAVGYRADSLPKSVQPSWRASTRRVIEAVRLRMEERDRQYLQAFERYLGETLERSAATALAGDEFERTRQVVREGLGEFHGVTGRPALNQVGDELRGKLDEGAREFEKRWTRRVDAAERQVAAQLRSEVDKEVMNLRQQLDEGGSAVDVRRRLETFRRRRLAEHYPGSEAFSIAVNPWNQVDADISRLLRDIEGRDRTARDEELTQYLEFAYQSIADSGVDIALGIFESSSRDLELERANRHADAFRAAREVRDLVLGKLISDNVALRRVPIRGGGTVLVVRSDGRLELRAESAEEPLPFAIVARALLELVPAEMVLKPGQDDSRRRVGLCFWYLFAGRSGEGLQLVQELDEWSRFFKIDAFRLVDATRVRDFGSDRGVSFRADRILADMVRARDRGDVGGVKVALDQFDKLPRAQVDAADLAVRNDVERWSKRRTKRLARLKELRGRVPAGAIVTVGDDESERIEYSLGALQQLELHGAWEIRPDGAFMTGDDLSIAEAWERRIELPAEVSHESGLRCEIDLAVDRHDSVPQVLMFSLRSACCMVVVLPNGAVLAEVVEDAALRSRDEINRPMRALLARAADVDGPWMVPGARHRLSFELLGRGRTKMRVAIDGNELCEERVVVPANPPSGFLMVPYQPTVVVRVAMNSGS